MAELQTLPADTHPGDGVAISRTALGGLAACLLLMGLVAAAYGPLLEHLTRRFDITLPVAGEVFSSHFAGALVGVIAAMWAMERTAGRWSVWVALASMAVGAAVVALSTSWPVFLAGVFGIGAGFGGLDISVNQLIAYSKGPRRVALLNAVNGAFGFGAVAAPILISRFGQDHLAMIYAGFAVLAVACIPATAGISGRLPVVPRQRGTRPGLLVGIFLAAYLFYVGTEAGVGGWMTSHLESVGWPSLDAAALTSGFWLATAVGRLLVVLIPDRMPPSFIVIAGSAVASIALLVALSGRAAPIAYIVTGLAIAPIFPTGIVWLARLRPGDSRSTSWLFPASMVGGAIVPAGISLVIAWLGIGWAPAVLSAVAICTLIAFSLARLRSQE